MKKRRFRSFAKWGWFLGVLCWVTVVSTPELLAVISTTVDSDGLTGGTRGMMEKRPEVNLPEMKRQLRVGNLEAVGGLAMQALSLSPANADAKVFYSMFLSSQDEAAKARQALQEAMGGAGGNQYALYAEAMILRLEKQYEAALESCRKAVALDKTHPYPWNIMGRIYTTMGRYDEAIASFQKAIELEPKFLPAYSNLGAACFMAGRPDQAVEYFQKALSLNADSLTARYGLAQVYRSQGNVRAASAELTKIVESKSASPAVWQELGELQLGAGEYDAALTTGQEMEKSGMAGAFEILADAALHLGDPQGAMRYLEKAPSDSVAAQYLLGCCFMAEEQYQEALAQMESVLQKNPEHFGAYSARVALKFYLGDQLNVEKDLKNRWGEGLDKSLNFMAGNVLASKENWTEALQRWKASDGVVAGFSVEGLDEGTLAKGAKKGEFKFLNLGALYLIRNLNQLALKEFGRAVSLNADSILANYWAAQGSLRIGDRPKAVQSLEIATWKAPKFFAALYTLGELNFLLGKKDVAVQFYQRALEVRRDAGIMVKLGLLYEDAKNYEKSDKQYEELIAAYPDLFVGYNQLAWSYAQREVKLDKAMALAEKANQLMPENASILDTIGWTYFQMKNYSKAAEYLLRAEKINPNNLTILEHLAAVYRAMGDKQEAEKYQQMAAELSKAAKASTEEKKGKN